MKVHSNDSRIGTAGALLANIIFGFSFLFSKMALNTGAHPLMILSLRFTLAFAVMGTAALTGIIHIRFRGKPLFRLLLMAVFQPLLYFIAELYAIRFTSTALSGVVIGAIPVFVMIASGLFLHERPTWAQWFFGLAAVGLIAAIQLLSGSSGRSELMGVLLLFAAVLCASAFNLLSRSTAAVFSAAERTFMMFTVGAVGTDLITLFVLRNRFWGELIFEVRQPTLWAALLYLSVLSSCLAYALYNTATGKISLVRASAFSSVIPVVSTLAGVLILKEPMSWQQVLLCFAVIACVTCVNCFEKPMNPPQKESENSCDRNQ